MIRKIFSHGALAGLIVGLPLFGITVAMNGHTLKYGVVLGYLTMLIALSLVFVAIKRRRDVDLGGVIRFWPAFGLGSRSVRSPACFTWWRGRRRWPSRAWTSPVTTRRC